MSRAAKLRDLEKRLAKEPDNLGLRVALAGALCEAGRNGDGVELYRSVAVAYRDQGRTHQALVVCRAVLEIAPGDLGCQALLAELVASQEAPPAAVEMEAGTPPPREMPDGSDERSVATGTGAGPRQPKASSVPPMAAPRPSRPSVPVPAPAPRPSMRPSVPLPAGGKAPPSGETTPLPKAVPHHVYDPTAGRERVDLTAPPFGGAEGRAQVPGGDLTAPPFGGAEGGAQVPALDPDDLPVVEGAQTRPGADLRRAQVTGLAQAARRISGLLGPDGAETPRFDDLDDLPTPPPRLPGWTRPATPTEPVDLASESSGDISGDITGDVPDDGDRTQPRALQDNPLTGPFFAKIPADKRSAVLARFEARRVRAGTVVIRQGETNHSFFVVISGTLSIRVDRPDGSLIELEPLTDGDYVGAAALLARQPSAIKVVAAFDCELLALAARELYELAGAFPALWAALKDTAERRFRELDAKLKK